MAEKDVLITILAITKETTEKIIDCSNPDDQKNIITAALGVIGGVCMGAIEREVK